MTKPSMPSTDAAPTRQALFGPPPLLEGEDPAIYDELLARVSGAVKPADMLEEVWVRDVVDLTWEIFRLRRLKTNLLIANAHTGLEDILKTFKTGFAEAEYFAQSWAARNQASIKEVNKILASAGLTMDAVMAQTLSLKINDVERIDRMTMGAEARRNAVLREIDRHRANLAHALRRVTEEVDDAEFHEVKATQITDRSAA
jgi:hypothetical protein